MAVALEHQEACLIAALCGELDHHSVRSIREEIDTAIIEQQPRRLELDFGQVTFMDSSGIGLILGRCKIMGGIGGKVVVRNPPPHIRRIMRLSGVERLAKIETSCANGGDIQ
jgi:stage II sporulation protein AA (anti-sigma F factor antagonist)